MITDIKITNSSGILEEVTLDLTKGKYDYRNKFVYKDTVINPAVLYGRNGSGKTSVLKSINNLIQIFSGDLQSGDYYAMPHLFTDNLETKIVVNFTLNDKKYEYEVHVEDRNNIIYEHLTSNGKELVYRNLNTCKIYNTMKEIDDSEFIANLSSKLSIVRYMGMNEINQEVAEVYSYFKNFRFIATNKSISAIGEIESIAQKLVKYNDKYSCIVDKYNHIMKLKFRIAKEPSRERIIAIYEKQGKEYELDFETQISSGTKDLYKLLALFFSLPDGSLVVIDEIEKAFHPELLDKLIEDVLEEVDLQIICSSHNTHLLTRLRPDQVYFTHRDNDMTHLTRLSVKHPGIREIHNIEKLYLGGRIG